jgi:hypothetical protein
MKQFEDIRPYRDSEVPSTLMRLIADSEFIDLLLSRKMPLLMGTIPWLIKPMGRFLLRKSLRKLIVDVKTVEDLQFHMTKSLKNILDKTTDGYSFGGLDQLDANTSYLFISNHRDIALDPAMVNLALHTVKLDTVRIAIGDNLLKKPFASDLMRINRSFIVKRSATGRREKLEALKTLSSYIRHSIVDETVSCWIAQAEGRAKDGNDRTETALLKMLTLSKPKQQSFAEAIAELQLMPVALSYEYDPCIVEKASELYAESQGQTYVKGEFEDLDSIQKGFVEYKGRVQVNFGQPITDELQNADELAAEIDRQICSLYQLFPTNIIAWEMQKKRDRAIVELLRQQWPDENWDEAEQKFYAHLDCVSDQHKPVVISIYARPVDNQLSYHEPIL